MPSFPRSAWSTSTSWLSRTLVSEKMLRMSSSTISTLAPASSGTGRVERLRRPRPWLALARLLLARLPRRSDVKTRTRSARSAGFSVTPNAPMPITDSLRSAPEMTWIGMWLVSRIVLQQVEQHEAVDVGEPEVERDRRRLKLARHRQRARAGGRDHALEARLVRGIEQDRGEGRVVLDDQHERVLAELVAVVVDLEARRQRRRHDRAAIVVARRRPVDGRARSSFGFERHVEREGRAFARASSGPAARRRAGARSRG